MIRLRGKVLSYRLLVKIHSFDSKTHSLEALAWSYFGHFTARRLFRASSSQARVAL